MTERPPMTRRLGFRLLVMVLLAALVPFAAGTGWYLAGEREGLQLDLEQRQASVQGYYRELERQRVAIMREQAESAARMLSQAAPDAFATWDYRSLRLLADGLRKNPNIADLEVTAVPGRIVVPPARPWPANSAADVRTFPIRRDTEVLGEVRVLLDRGPIEQLSAELQDRLRSEAEGMQRTARDRWRRFASETTVVFVAMAMLVAGVVVVAVRKLVVRRLRRLADHCAAMRGGDYSTPCAVEGRDELATVTASFNAMLERVRAKHDELELLVAQRTQELADSNRELQGAVGRAERATRAKSEFLAVMSHEIRTPMNAVIGAADLLTDSALTSTQRDLVDTVRLSGDLLLSLINDILDFSKIEAGKITLENAVFDLDLEIETVCRTMEERVRQRGIELRVAMDDAVPDLLVGDSVRLRQVLLNLVSNAIKFTERGSVTIHVRIERQAGAEILLRCEVQDTGIGISEGAQQRLFRAFEQADASTTRRFGGTGLGLAISKRLCELMGGTIGVRSVTGSGSTFWFTATLTVADDMQYAQLAQESGVRGRRVLAVVADTGLAPRLIRFLMSRGVEAGVLSAARLPDLVAVAGHQRWDALVLDAGALGTAPESLGSLGVPTLVLGATTAVVPNAVNVSLPLRKSAFLQALGQLCTASMPAAAPARPGAGRRVLVADDNQVNCKVLTAMLERAGCTVVLANDGAQAVAAWRERPVDLVFMDYQMPVLDGIAATRAIRAEEPAGRRVPIVALTANAAADVWPECEQAGMDAFLAKPVRLASLTKMLEQHLAASPEPVSQEQ